MKPIARILTPTRRAFVEYCNQHRLLYFRIQNIVNRKGAVGVGGTVYVITEDAETMREYTGHHDALIAYDDLRKQSKFVNLVYVHPNEKIPVDDMVKAEEE